MRIRRIVPGVSSSRSHRHRGYAGLRIGGDLHADDRAKDAPGCCGTPRPPTRPGRQLRQRLTLPAPPCPGERRPLSAALRMALRRAVAVLQLRHHRASGGGPARGSGNMSLLRRPRPGAPQGVPRALGLGRTGGVAHWDQTCTLRADHRRSINVTLAAIADGYGKYLADWVQQLGGTNWTEVTTQYYEADRSSSANRDYIQPDKDWLVRDLGRRQRSNDAQPLPQKSNSTNPCRADQHVLADRQEALRAAAHFDVSGDALDDANFIIVQPPALHRPERAHGRLLRVPRLHRPQCPRELLLRGSEAAGRLAGSVSPVHQCAACSRSPRAAFERMR